MSNGGVAKGGPMPESRVAHRPNAGVRMKRENERVDQTLTAASTTSPVADDDADLKMHGSEKARHAREAIRARQPRGPSTPGRSGSCPRQHRPIQLSCAARSAAASYARSCRWPTRRSTSWSGAGNFPSGSSSRRAASCGTCPKCWLGCKAGGRPGAMGRRRRRCRTCGKGCADRAG